MRTARLEFAPILDVLIITFFVLIVDRERETDVQLEEIAAEYEVGQLRHQGVEEAHHLASQSLAVSVGLLAQNDRRVSDLEQALAEQARHVSELQEAIEAASTLEGLGTDAQQSLLQLMQNAITVVEFSVRGDEVATYRRLPSGEREALREPVALTRVQPREGMSSVVDYDREYLPDFLNRLNAVLDNTLRQRDPSDRIFYLFINAGENTCTALIGLTREIQSRSDMVSVTPRHACGL